LIRWLWIALGLILVWLFRRAMRPADRKPPVSGGGPGRRGGAGSSERMVRDRVCNTFLPRSKAIVHTDADGEHYFCSAACRDRYLSSSTG
jgi:hypothetical protein